MTDAGMRLSDAERDRTIELLAEHAAAGRLTDDELSERTGRAAAATVRGDLRELFIDLPDPHPFPEAASADQASADQASADQASADQADSAGQSEASSSWPTYGQGPSPSGGSTGTSGPWPTMGTPPPSDTGSSTRGNSWPTLGQPDQPASQTPSSGPFGTYQPADSSSLAQNPSYSQNPSYPAEPQRSEIDGWQKYLKYLWYVIPAVVIFSIATRGNMSFLIPIVCIAVFFIIRANNRR